MPETDADAHTEAGVGGVIQPSPTHLPHCRPAGLQPLAGPLSPLPAQGNSWVGE